MGKHTPSITFSSQVVVHSWVVGVVVIAVVLKINCFFLPVVQPHSSNMIENIETVQNDRKSEMKETIKITQRRKMIEILKVVFCRSLLSHPGWLELGRL